MEAPLSHAPAAHHLIDTLFTGMKEFTKLGLSIMNFEL
jgi:hypothetical protein